MVSSGPWMHEDNLTWWKDDVDLGLFHFALVSIVRGVPVHVPPRHHIISESALTTSIYTMLIQDLHLSCLPVTINRGR
jgi:hypothetical protein